MLNTPIHVAVAVIADKQGRILISRRPAHTHLGGMWEFPGGKLEPGEDLARALKRELAEELGVCTVQHRPLIRLVHHYSDRSVLLDVHHITEFSGEARGLEGQALAWVSPGELDTYPLLPADRPIVTALRLPDHYLITGPDPTDRAAFLGRLAQALESGVKLVQLRAKGLAEAEYRSLAEEALALCRQKGARLLLNASPALAEEIGADGVHLASRWLQSVDERPLGTGKLVGASCHNREELARAGALGLDFALLSPVRVTASHPHVPPLGWERFAEWVGEATLPVYALGGMKVEHIPHAWAHGAQGIAGISGFWPELQAKP